MTTLGNAMIQPTMYFNLRHVPMFNGPYQILDVKHKITPGKFDTTFTGIRLQKFAFPKLDEYIQALTQKLVSEVLQKIRQDKRLIKFISDFHKLDRVIACICSGAQLLISAKIVKGKKIAGYYSMQDDLVNAGAIYTDLPAVVDGKIITTAHYKDMGPWMKSTLEFFNES